MMFNRSSFALILLASSLGFTRAQGISTRRDAAGNIPRDSGIAAQSVYPPMTNNAVRTVQSPSYVTIGRLRPVSIPIRPVAGRSEGLR
jgi:hypothetical protein